MVGVEVGWSVVEEWLLSEGACCGGSEAGERRSERGDTAYSPRVPRGGAFGSRRTLQRRQELLEVLDAKVHTNF